MLSFIFWIIGGAIALVILYFVGVFLFTFFSIKQALGWAKEEIDQVPKDYHALRKEVKNENASQGTEVFVKTTFRRWFDRLR